MGVLIIGIILGGVAVWGFIEWSFKMQTVGEERFKRKLEEGGFQIRIEKIVIIISELENEQ